MMNILLTLLLLTQNANVVQQVDVQKSSPPAASSQWSWKGYFTSFRVGVTGLGGGPLMFKDTEDQRLEDLSLMELGGGLQFTFGDYRHDTNHFGLGFEYRMVAHSDTRDLAYMTPYLVYDAGFPFAAELRVGYNLTQGTEGFAENYEGIYMAAALKYTFARADKLPVLMGLALYGEYVLPTEDMSYASGFVGVRMEVSYAKARK